MSVGLIGLGAMGLPMSRNMVLRGHTVVGYDVAAERLAAAADVGVEPAGSLAELMDACDVVLACLPTDESMVALGHDAVPHIRAGHLLVVTGTHSLAVMSTLDRLFRAAGASVVDAPVVFGGTNTANGTLVSLLGGTETDVERARPVVMGYSKDAEHVGPLGAGQVAKACNNYLHWVHSVSNFEALALAKRYGVDAEKMRQVLMKSPGDNGTLRNFDRYRFTWHEKDMDLVLDLAQDGGLMLPMAAQTDQLVKSITQGEVIRLLGDESCVYLGQTVTARAAGGVGDLDALPRARR
ncbi:NAD(P)-dependent oxidoreductase [Nocardioides panacis]|uniref:NAD(P)-dependent oxidoreductase n=1 Tax=Nocardioides panacis TaxID=2849501 RepID=A0A975T201_9ACTN|nr:NAD(P)-dependent oxidoreductase [Nocardioides panacis]QWZ10150.1 NAD(P)-dependent oxidoreductase [Nocardioides panacis]